jgi:aryl-alcohol dehydrogenase-like predicted oxidoreductase
MTLTSLPNTDLAVFPICLGTGEVGTRLGQQESFALLDSYVELGGNFLDTAHNYGDWVKDAPRSASERTIGAWLTARGNRGQIVLATKGAYPLLDGRDVPRSSREEIVHDLDESLHCLQTDVIDLYWIHKDDPTRPVEEIVETLEEQSRAGKIRYYGASNFAADRLRAAYRYALEQGYRGFVADQVLWNAAVLAKYPYGDPGVCFMDADRYQFHLETGMAAIPFQSQAYGLFNRMDQGTLEQMNPGFRGFYRLPESRARYDRMRLLMDETGLTITQVILAYLTSQPFPTVPIVGCQSPQQVADSMSAAGIQLTPAQIERIGDPVQSIGM